MVELVSTLPTHKQREQDVQLFNQLEELEKRSKQLQPITALKANTMRYQYFLPGAAN
jgi:hypothetical protein